MKKSVKDQLWWLRKNEQLYMLRLFRRACKEAYFKGHADSLQGFSNSTAALSEIINGPRKARGR